MCGRFSLKASPDDLQKTLEIELPPDYRPRYNIAPTQDVLCVVMTDGERRGRMLRWGLVPFWADDPRIGNRMINARAETAASKPAFRDSFARRRCLIAVDGFYEWQVTGGGKQPMRIRRPDDAPFCFAGLWSRWEGEGTVIESCTILTQAAVGPIRSVHDRMPVILGAEGGTEWMGVDGDARAVLAAAAAGAPFPLDIYPVSTIVNRPANDIPECVAPLVE